MQIKEVATWDPKAHKDDHKELMSSKGGWGHLGVTWKQEKRTSKEDKRTK